MIFQRMKEDRKKWSIVVIEITMSVGSEEVVLLFEHDRVAWEVAWGIAEIASDWVRLSEFLESRRVIVDDCYFVLVVGSVRVRKGFFFLYLLETHFSLWTQRFVTPILKLSLWSRLFVTYLFFDDRWAYGSNWLTEIVRYGLLRLEFKAGSLLDIFNFLDISEFSICLLID